MKNFITIIRVHGVIDPTKYGQVGKLDNRLIGKNKSSIQYGEDCGDDILNEYLDSGSKIVDIQTMYDPESKVLMDIIYLQPNPDDSYGGGNDDDAGQPSDPVEPDGLAKSVPFFNQLIYKGIGD